MSSRFRSMEIRLVAEGARLHAAFVESAGRQARIYRSDTVRDTSAGVLHRSRDFVCSASTLSFDILATEDVFL